MKSTFFVLSLMTLLSISLAYEFDQPKNGTELEETLRSELDDIWVIQWYKKQSGSDDAGDDADQFDKTIDGFQDQVRVTCPTLTKEYKFVQADLDPELQKDGEDSDVETDFKELMTKLHIDEALLDDGSVISVLYRLNGVKVWGLDSDVKVCDIIEMKKEERKEHDKEEAKNEKDTGAPAPEKPEQPTNLIGKGVHHLGGSRN